MVSLVSAAHNETHPFSLVGPDENISGGELDIRQMLANMNFGLQEELEVCEAELSSNKFSRNITYVSLAIAVSLAIWKTSDIFRGKKK